MAKVVVSLKDFDVCCRCCLLTIGPMKPIFTSCLNGMLEQVIGLQITQNDGLPQQMCSRCILKLSSAHTFYNTVKTNHKTLELVLKEAPKQDAFEELPSAKNEVEEKKEKTLVKIELEKKITANEEIAESAACTKLSSLDPGDASERLPDLAETHQCPQCDHSASSQEELKIHLQTHSIGKKEIVTDLAEPAQLCSFCGARFRWRSSLAKHARRHRGAALACRYCDKRFAEASTLRVHLVRRHSLVNPQPFVCAVCRKCFTQRSSLNKHAKSHVKSEPLHCPDCGKDFLHRYSLRNHRAREHAMTECSLCSKYFTGKKALNIHMKTHEAKSSKLSDTARLTVKQRTVGNGLTDRADMQLVTVEFLCLLCGNRFQSKDSLEEHLCKTTTMYKVIPR